MAKSNKTAIQKQLTAQKARMTSLISGAEGMAGMVVKTKRRLDQVVEKAKEEHTTTRTLTADAGAAVIAHGANELIALGARAIGEWSQRTGGQEAHFAKNVGLYSSLPQSAIGAAIYIIELATRDSETLSLSLSRDITSRASNLLVNLGLSNTIRAIRYQLAKSIDEDQEANAEKNALINKVAELQKRLDGK